MSLPQEQKDTIREEFWKTVREVNVEDIQSETIYLVSDENINTLIEKAYQQGAKDKVEEVNENTSDGYHTFKELYEYRKIYNALIFNEWAKSGKYEVHKSKKHSDGELCFGGGWFIVVAELPTGQISNHYELSDWDLFKCEEREIPNTFDGHSPEDVKNRTLESLKDNT